MKPRLLPLLALLLLGIANVFTQFTIHGQRKIISEQQGVMSEQNSALLKQGSALKSMDSALDAQSQAISDLMKSKAPHCLVIQIPLPSPAAKAPRTPTKGAV